MTYIHFFPSNTCRLLVGRCGVKASFWVTQALCKLKKVRSRAQRGGDIDSEPGAEWTRKRARAAEGEEQQPAYVC